MSTINVLYKCIDGAHFFVSEDKEAAGLCVAHNDLQTAFNEVSYQLGVLFEQNHGEKCKFIPGVPFEAFAKAIAASQLVAKGADQSGMMKLASIQPWMYELKAGAH